MKEKEDFTEWHNYQAWLLDVPENLDYDGICEAIIARTPYLARRQATERVFEESGINRLLEQMNALLLGQCIEMLEEEANPMIIEERELNL